MRTAAFRSKYDTWLVVLAGSFVPAAAATVLTLSRRSEPSWIDALTVALMLGVAVMLAWSLWATRYVVSATALDIQCGPFRWSVPLASIRSVEPTRDTTSGPAWSLDRLCVTAADKTVLISPLDKAGFLAALQTGDAGLRRDGQRLVRFPAGLHSQGADASRNSR